MASRGHDSPQEIPRLDREVFFCFSLAPDFGRVDAVNPHRGSDRYIQPGLRIGGQAPCSNLSKSVVATSCDNET